MTADDYIYTQVTNAVRTQYPSCYRSGKFEMVAEHFPAIYVVKTNAERTLGGLNLVYGDNQHRVTYQVDVYTTGENEMTTAEAIISLVENAFSNLYFRMTYCQPTQNIDPTVYRITARFERILCGNELTPTINTEDN